MPMLKLRSVARSVLTDHEVARCIRRYDFFHRGQLDAFDDFWWQNPGGSGIRHDYCVAGDGAFVVDRATQLLWQRDEGPRVAFDEAGGYIAGLNQSRFGGFDDWRLPTLEEAMSLLEPRNRSASWVDPVFSWSQGWIWTGDQRNEREAWVVSLRYGTCFPCERNVDWYSAQAVRSVR